MFSKSDIVQITDENHGWYGCLLIVDEVKSWGIVGYIACPQSNDGSIAPSFAYNRLKNDQIEVVLMSYCNQLLIPL